MSEQIAISVPKMGMDTTEVQISNWFVKPGDSVKVGTHLVEIESEKTTFTVESEVTGTITDIIHPVGSVAAISEVLCYIQT